MKIWFIVVLTSLLTGCVNNAGENLMTADQLNGIAGQKGLSPNSANAFRFVILADRTGGADVGALTRVVDEVNRLKPDFVISIGDFVQGYTSDKAELKAQWDEIHQELKGLEAPFFYCPGNHDVLDLEPRKMYTRLHGINDKTYYSFNYRYCHFIVLDSSAMIYENAPKDIQDAQWAWLEKDLAAAKSARHIFIFEHHPLFFRPEWKRLLPMLEPAKTTVFSGHEHIMSYDLENDVPYFILGTTGQKIKDPNRWFGSFSMFAQVTVDSGKPTVALIPAGEILPQTLIERHARKVFLDATKSIVLHPITKNGGKLEGRLSNQSTVEVNYKLRWTGQGQVFPNGNEYSLTLPAAKELTTKQASSDAGQQRAQRTTSSWDITTPRIPATASFTAVLGKLSTEVPSFDVQCDFVLAGKKYSEHRRIEVPVVDEVPAVKQENIVIDGSLDDWAGIAGRQDLMPVTDHIATRPAENCSVITRIAYDDKNLYVAMDVSDDNIATDGEEAWQKDGIEIFWDPRDPECADFAFKKPCGQILIPVPPEGQAAKVFAGLEDKDLIAQARAVVRRRPHGYIVEAAIPLSSIDKGFKPSAGKMLRMNFHVNDKDKKGGPTRTLILSGQDASHGTTRYVFVKFE